MGVIVHDDDFSSDTAAEYQETINSGITVAGGVLRANATGQSYVVPRRVYDHDSSWGPSQLRMRIVVGNLQNNGSTAGLGLRAIGDGNNYVAAIIGAASQSLVEVVGGSTVVSDSATESVGSASVLGAWAQGDQAWVTLDGVEILRITVTTMLGHGSGSLLLDNVSANTDVTISEWLTEAFAPYIAAVGSPSSGTGNVNPAVAGPHYADDVIFCVIESCGGEAANLGTANGFAAGPISNTGTTTNGTRLTVYAKTATGSSEAGPTVTDPGNHVHALTYVVRAADPSGLDFDSAAVKASASTSATAPGGTTSVDNVLVVHHISRDNDSTAAAFSSPANASLSGLWEIFESGTDNGNGGGIGVFNGTRLEAGTVTGMTATVTSSINAMLTVGFKPPVSGVADLDGGAVAGATGTAVLSKGVGLAGAAVAAAVGAGSLSHAIPLAGAAAASALAEADLLVVGNANLEGAAIASAIADGALTLSIHFGGDAFASAVGAAQLQHAVHLAGGASASALAIATLSVDVSLTGEAVAQLAASASLSKGVSLDGSATAAVAVTGSLQVSAHLTGSAAAGAAAAAALALEVPLEGDATAGAQAAAELQGSASLAGAASAGSQAAGTLTLQVPLTAQAVAHALASGALSLNINLQADAIAQALAGGSLTVLANIELVGSAVGGAAATGSLQLGDPLPPLTQASLLSFTTRRAHSSFRARQFSARLH